MKIENIPEFTVTTLSQSIKKTLETQFEYVRVKGELGRVSRPASGHIYFDLKDEKSILASVVWRGTRITKRDLIEEGNEVVLVGRLSSFPGHSRYQIIVEDIQASGIGALLAMLNKRREKLAGEGLFSKEKKFITSCIFRVKSEPSALYKCLGGFATNQVNLTKLESFSVKNTFDQANFYLDLEGHIEQPEVKKALEELGFHTETLDILGVYEASKFRQK